MLDFDRVLLSFYQLSGCRNDKVDEVETLVMEAMKAVEAVLDGVDVGFHLRIPSSCLMTEVSASL